MFSVYYKSQTQPDGGEGCSGRQLGGSIRTWGESHSAEAEYRKCTGRRTETESGWSGGTSPQHRIKSSIHYKPHCVSEIAAVNVTGLEGRTGRPKPWRQWDIAS